MKINLLLISLIIVLPVVFLACGKGPAFSAPSKETTTISIEPEPSDSESAKSAATALKLPENYPREAARDLLSKIVQSESTEYEIALTIYNYLISHVYFADPIGLDIWRYRSNQTEPPTYVENRSLSPILFGVGSCEDFAAAMVILLQESGIDAVYVAGYTLSYRGGYTDHAWVVAKIDGAWYHFDPQLEQDIYPGGKIPYRFFMATDDEMLGSHLWGESLINFCGDRATIEEVQRIRSEYSPPACVVAVNKPEAAEVGVAVKPDIKALSEQIKEEKAAHPLLADIVINTDPPVLVKDQPLVEID